MRQPGAAERQWHCQQLLLKFFHLLDARRYAEVVELFEEEGQWLRPGAAMRGRAEVEAALAQRPRHRVTRHLVSNFLVLEDRGESVDSVAHLTTYAFDSGTPPPALHGPVGIFTANTRFNCAPGPIRIAKLELAPEFNFLPTPS